MLAAGAAGRDDCGAAGIDGGDIVTLCALVTEASPAGPLLDASDSLEFLAFDTELVGVLADDASYAVVEAVRCCIYL